MNPPTLHYHPLSSCCHKVLIALEVLGIDVELRVLNLGDASERTAFTHLWPVGKMPLLVDQGQVVPETSIIIEHLQRHHAKADRSLIPVDNADAALQVRLWDRVMDLYLMTPMQALTADLLSTEGERDARGVAQARDRLRSTYALADQQLQGRHGWLVGDAFTLADCAAAPALFYAVAYVPLPPEHRALAAYFERLMSHPAVARTIDQARPWFKFFPGRAGLDRRFFDPAVD